LDHVVFEVASDLDRGRELSLRLLCPSKRLQFGWEIVSLPEALLMQTELAESLQVCPNASLEFAVSADLLVGKSHVAARSTCDA
jgi:hypothetical protein